MQTHDVAEFFAARELDSCQAEQRVCYKISHLILLQPFLQQLIGCSSATLGRYVSSRDVRYAVRFWVVDGRKWCRDRKRRDSGKRRWVGTSRVRARIEPVRVATPT
jgi:hypothetical protein